MNQVSPEIVRVPEILRVLRKLHKRADNKGDAEAHELVHVLWMVLGYEQAESLHALEEA